MPKSRLPLKDLELFSVISAADCTQRSRIAWALARWAVDRVRLRHRVVEAVLAIAEIGSPGNPVMVKQIEELVATLDEEYFDLLDQAENDQASEPEILAAFGRARAANAVLFALAGDAAEAAYETIAATDELAEVQRIVRATLSREQ